MTPDPQAVANRRVIAETLARRAGAFLFDGLHRPRVAIETKSSGTDMVSEMDKGAEALLVEGIVQHFPDDGILGEEGTDRESRNGWRWVIDPLDGTTNYLYGHPFWSVSVGVEYLGAPTIGVVDVPTLKETFCASTGNGATRNGERIQTSQVTDNSLALVATGFGYSADRRAWQGSMVSALIPQLRDLRRGGSAAIDLAFVACGRVDGYYERGLNAWDMAAGIVLVREAGGTVTDLAGTGTPTSTFMVAAGQALHASLRSLLEGVAATVPEESPLR